MKLAPTHPKDLPDESGGDSAKDGVFQLRLFISGITPRSTMAIANIKAVCEEKLPHRYQLEIVDIYQQPKLAKENQIIAVPTLLKLGPLPPARLVGDMSDRIRVLRGLSLE